MEKIGEAITWLLVAVAASLHPWAAIGAGFGCCFFMAWPNSTRLSQRLFLLVFSWGMGYAGGVFWFGAGPPWDNRAMLVAGTISALVAVVFTGLFHVAAKGGPLPPWFESILDRVPFLKGRKGSDDGI